MCLQRSGWDGRRLGWTDPLEELRAPSRYVTWLTLSDVGCPFPACASLSQSLTHVARSRCFLGCGSVSQSRSEKGGEKKNRERKKGPPPFLVHRPNTRVFQGANVVEKGKTGKRDAKRKRVLRDLNPRPAEDRNANFEITEVCRSTTELKTPCLSRNAQIVFIY